MKEERKSSGSNRPKSSSKKNYSNKKNYSRNNSRNNNIRYDNKPKAPEVKKVDPEEIRNVRAAQIQNEEEDDNGTIILIAIGILVLFGIIVGLIIGCKRTGEDDVEPVINNTKTNETVPVTIKEEVPVTKRVAMKTSTSSESENAVTNETGNQTEEEPVATYNVTYHEIHNNVKPKSITVKEGERLREYKFDGYAACKLSFDDNDGISYGMEITEDTDVYLDCVEDDRSVVYHINSEETIVDYITSGIIITLIDPVVPGQKGWSLYGFDGPIYEDATMVADNMRHDFYSVFDSEKANNATVQINYEDMNGEDETISHVILLNDEIDRIGNQTFDENNMTNIVKRQYDEFGPYYYYVPADESTLDANRFFVIEDLEEEFSPLDDEIEKGKMHTPEWYNPQVGDEVERKECELIEAITTNNDGEVNITFELGVQDDDLEEPEKPIGDVDFGKPGEEFGMIGGVESI